MDILPEASQSNSSDYFDEDDSQFLEALNNSVLPGDNLKPAGDKDEDIEQPEPPPPSQPDLKRRRCIDDEEVFREWSLSSGTLHQLPAQDEDIYGESHFGEFGEYMRRKRAKLQIQNAEIPSASKGGDGSSKIFEGLSIYINGWTRPSVQDLRQLIVKHGGLFQPYLDRKALVTHIITCSLTPAKIREFKHMKVVRSDWLVKSVESGVLLPWKNYVYVHGERPEDIQGTNKQKTLFDDQARSSVPSSSSMKSAMTRKPTDVAPGDGSYKTSESKSSTSSCASTPAAPVPFHPTTPTTTRSSTLAPQIPLANPLDISEPKSPKDTSNIPKYAASTSNPLAERVMANPEWRKAHTSIAPDYVEGFYKNSRLHYLSTWKSELKSLVQQAQERAESAGNELGDGRNSLHIGKVDSEAHTKEGGQVSMEGAELVKRSPSSKWKGKQKAVDNEDRVIMHCDFDCFFVSAGLVSRPHLKGKPVVVCHSQGAQGGASSTSEIASASYEARTFGIRNGMSLQQARKLCPTILTIPYEFERYKQLSLQFYTVLMSHADDLEAVSVDEALIDVTSTVSQLRSHAAMQGSPVDPAKDFAETIRAQVRKATDCEVSIGISHNILLARLATRRAKPASSYYLTSAEVPDFLAPLDIADLRGFGWSTKQKAQKSLGATTLAELAKKSKGVLCDALGKGTGETLYNALRGIDNKKLESDKPRKSVSCDINYGIRFGNNGQAEAFIYQMATEVKKRLEAIDMVGHSITLKIMKRDLTAPVEPPKFMGHGACDLFNKQMPLLVPGGHGTSDDKVIGEHAWRLLKSFNFDPKELRGIGIQLQKLEPASGGGNVGTGQAVLPFKRVESPKRAGPSAVESNEPKIVIQPPSQDENVTMHNGANENNGISAKPSMDVLELPSFSQVDKSVFEALPRDVREELEQEYKRRSASPFPVDAPAAAIASRLQNAGPSRRSVGPSIFPQKAIMKGTNYKRITHQLAPRLRGNVSPEKILLFGKKKKAASTVKVSGAELKRLNIDPEVFAMLPIRVQREQLVMARIVKEKGSIPEPPSQKIILKPCKPRRLPPHLLWRAPAPKARWLPPPFLRQQGKEKKDKLYFTETDDIQRVVENWVTSYRHWAPKERDVEFFAKYLVQSVDSATAGDVGVERAIAIMKWWLVLLRRFWPGSELVEEGEPDGSQTDRVGEAWWKSFRDVKEKMDVVARKKFGGKLSLK